MVSLAMIWRDREMKMMTSCLADLAISSDMENLTCTWSLVRIECESVLVCVCVCVNLFMCLCVSRSNKSELQDGDQEGWKHG